MGNHIVVDKLILGNETIGYRFNIMNNGDLVVALDIKKKNANLFLNILNRDDVVKGKIIRGELVDGVFITKDRSEVKSIEVLSIESALEYLSKYYQSDDSESDDNFRDVEKEERDYIQKQINKYKAKGVVKYKDIEGRYDVCHTWFIYNFIRYCAKGLNYSLKTDYFKYSHRDECSLFFNCYFFSFEDLIKFWNTVSKITGCKQVPEGLKPEDIVGYGLIDFWMFSVDCEYSAYGGEPVCLYSLSLITHGLSLISDKSFYPDYFKYINFNYFGLWSDTCCKASFHYPKYLEKLLDKEITFTGYTKKVFDYYYLYPSKLKNNDIPFLTKLRRDLIGIDCDLYQYFVGYSSRFLMKFGSVRDMLLYLHRSEFLEVVYNCIVFYKEGNSVRMSIDTFCSQSEFLLNFGNLDSITAIFGSTVVDNCYILCSDGKFTSVVGDFGIKGAFDEENFEEDTNYKEVSPDEFDNLKKRYLNK